MIRSWSVLVKPKFNPAAIITLFTHHQQCRALRRKNMKIAKIEPGREYRYIALSSPDDLTKAYACEFGQGKTGCRLGIVVASYPVRRFADFARVFCGKLSSKAVTVMDSEKKSFLPPQIRVS